jgi:hypothetical protein
VVDTIDLDDSEVVAINGENVIWIARGVDDPEAITLVLHDVDDGKIRGLGVRKSSPLSIDEGRVVGERSDDQGGDLVIPVSESNDCCLIIDIVGRQIRIVWVVYD